MKLNDLLNNIKIKQQDLEIISLFKEDLEITLAGFPSMVDFKKFNDFYFLKINSKNYLHLHHEIPGIFSRLNDYTIENFSYNLSKGCIIIIIQDVCYNINLPVIPKRTPTNSELDPMNLLDSHDGLNEVLNDNIALIRKRLKSEHLCTEKFVLGQLSQTDCIVFYLDEFKNKPYINKIRTSLMNYEALTVTNINDLNSVFQSSSLVPSVFNTSSPDYIVGSILEGKVVILMDNSPVAIILPTTLTMFTSIKNESNEPKYYTLFARLFTILFFYLSLFSIGFIIALTNFHPTLFSTLFMSNLQITERGTTFPLFIESIIVLFLFEFFRLISSRSPNNYVQNIIIIFSGMFIGQNAISSGIVGESILLLTAISYVSAFAITNNQHLITSIDLFRLYNLILSYAFGIIGFAIGFITTIGYLAMQKSVGEPLLSPFVPLNKKGIKNFIYPKHGVNHEE